MIVPTLAGRDAADIPLGELEDVDRQPVVHAQVGAVVSMTFNPRSIASRCVSSGRNRASGFSFGSLSYTPSTLFFAMRIAWAPISKAPAELRHVSVEERVAGAGREDPPLFERCRIARRRMYGS